MDSEQIRPDICVAPKTTLSDLHPFLAFLRVFVPSWSLNSSCFDEVLFPEFRAEAVGAHAPAGGRRMHESAVPEVDADVGGFLSFLIEKQQEGKKSSHVGIYLGNGRFVH